MYHTRLVKDYINCSKFVVCPASAGTGKTHQITKEELRHIFEGEGADFISITFTNAAAKEMKERIIDYLIKLASTKDIKRLKEDKKIANILEIIPESRVKNSSRILLKLLDNYSSLSIGTIDSLAVKMLRAYQDRTDLPMDVGIIMEGDEFFEELIVDSITEYLSSIKSEEEKIELLKVLIKENVERDKYISTSIIESISKYITSCHNILISRGIRSLASELTKEVFESYDKLQKEIEDLISKIEQFNSDGNKFVNGYFINYLEDVKDSFPSPELKTYKDNVNKSCKSEKTRKEIEKHIKNFYQKITKYVFQKELEHNIKNTSFYTNFLKYYNEKKPFLLEIPLNNVYLELLNLLSQDQDYAKEIFIRMGKEASLLLIDEFQDTSIEQFRALKPLIDQIINKKKGKVVVVGDIKQAIFRFRGGDYRLLHALMDKDNLSEVLKKNYRSKKEIVNFVGKFFPGEEEDIKIICNDLDFTRGEEEKRKAYKEAFSYVKISDVKNVKSDKEGGYVEINTYGIDFQKIEKGEDKSQFLKKYELEDILGDIEAKIRELKKRGYLYNDICIIAHENYEVKEISSYLSLKKIPFKTSSDIDVRDRGISKEILSILKFASGEQYRGNLFSILTSRLLENKVRSFGLQKEYEKLLNDFKADPSDSFKLDKDSQIYRECFEEILKNANTLSAYEMLLLIYRTFDITSEAYKNEQLTYMTLLDAAIKIERDKDSTIKTFIEEFEKETEDDQFESQDIWSMNVAESIDAINVSTIHKVKGLSSKVVFYVVRRKSPRDNEDEIFVLRVKDKDYLIRNSDYMTFYLEYLDFIENKEDIKKEIEQKDRITAADIINLHYVALTRAENELYVYLYNRSENAGTKSIITAMTYNFYKKSKTLGFKVERTDNMKYRISKGKVEKNEKVGKERFKPVTTGTIPPRRILYLKSFLNRDEQAKIGTIIHNVLSKLEFVDFSRIDEEIKEAINKTERDGIIVPEREKIESEIKKILTDDMMKWAFDKREGRVVRNEMEFVDESGSLFRADRVVIDREKVVVIDYKSGNPTEEEIREYRRQVRGYKEALQRMYGRDVEGLIFYIERGEVERI